MLVNPLENIPTATDIPSDANAEIITNTQIMSDNLTTIDIDYYLYSLVHIPADQLNKSIPQ